MTAAVPERGPGSDPGAMGTPVRLLGLLPAAASLTPAPPGLAGPHGPWFCALCEGPSLLEEVLPDDLEIVRAAADVGALLSFPT